ncbi:MAG: type II toxin-antitoxin system Phd/YefM family antitoxin [Planctomycetes bacterium]|nr:type II toxin-antitoxin system Phd/YefM family antitoxin [Planctomycetota bacterium]
MKYSKQIKSISYLKAHTSELIDEVTETRSPMIITKNGEAKAVVIDVRSYEKSQETMALLKILALSDQQIKEGKYKPVDEAFASIRKRVKKSK